jgi:hypothetical protein
MFMLPGLFAPIGMMSTRLVGPGGFHFRKRVDAQGRPRSVHARQGSLLRLLDLFDVMPLKSSLPPKPKPEPKPGQPPPPPRPPPAPPGPFPGDKDK